MRRQCEEVHVGCSWLTSVRQASFGSGVALSVKRSRSGRSHRCLSHEECSRAILFLCEGYKIQASIVGEFVIVDSQDRAQKERCKHC